MSTIGTAGHVDHGKSTLVKALTGIDPDRLAEEKARGMTIDLGFAWLQLPSGREVSIVDVPGHERFIKNMLAGVGGIDAALLVIAADEGIMPQTREHLAILDLLRVRRGIVVLSKADLVDEEWLEMLHEEVVTFLASTVLAGVPVLPISARSGLGLPALLAQLEDLLAKAEEQQDISRPRLPVDRVFSLAGFGTIATGTLLDGSFRIGQEVEILPQGLKTRIRSLQTHQHSVDVAQPGSRVAMNLARVPSSSLVRGNVVALPGQLRSTLLIDARLHLLGEAAQPLAHNGILNFYSGSQEVAARVRLLDAEELQPGQDAWVQLRFQQPAVLARRDRFILRLPSPGRTIGGGEVVDVQPRYHRRFQQAVLSQLSTLQHGTPEELVLSALDRRVRKGETTPAPTGYEQRVGKVRHGLMGYDLAEISGHTQLAEDVTQQSLETLLREGRVRLVGGQGEPKLGNHWFARSVWDTLVEETTRMVSEYHRRFPLRSGLAKEEWRTRLRLPPKLAAEIYTALQSEGIVAEAKGGISGGGSMRTPSFEPSFSETQQQQVSQLLHQFRQSPYTPPSRADAEAIVGTEIVAALIEQRQLVKVGDGVLFLCETYDEAIAKLVTYLREHGTMTAAQARDVLGTTRKYILPLLEQMDIQKITRRIGDDRVLGTPPMPFS